MENFEVERINVLTRDSYYQAIHALRGGLPPPITDDPDELARRDNAAMAEVASLVPANAEEIKLAVLFVTASAHAMDILRVESAPGMDAMKRWAQSASMMRQASGTRSLLLRVQAARLKREASNPATDAAAWIEYNALNHMATALGRSWAGPPEETSKVDVGVLADPPAAELPSRSMPDFEIKSQTSGNEMLPRPGGPSPAADDASRSGSEPSHPAHMATAAQPGETRFRSGLSQPRSPSGSAPPMATSVPQGRPPDADGRLRAASG